ncbi:hypothetical protein K439DRAFT_564395 [Ramaria rubella]|nr:hypothetical protein K439DRAFT_564395 [Ramaria rubella]
MTSLVASCMLQLFDYGLTIDHEVQFVWPSQWTVGKALYFSTTYISFMQVALLACAPFSACTAPFKTQIFVFTLGTWLMILTMGIAELVLLYRTWALWERSRNVAIGLLIPFVILGVASVVLVNYGLHHIQFNGPHTYNVAPIAFVSYIFLVVYEIVMLCLNLYKAKEHFQFTRSHLAVVLYRDGVLYFVYLITFSLINIISRLVVHSTPPVNLTVMQAVLHSVLTKRLLLNMRVAASSDSERWAPRRGFTLSSLEFFPGGQCITVISPSTTNGRDLPGVTEKRLGGDISRDSV